MGDATKDVIHKILENLTLLDIPLKNSLELSTYLALTTLNPATSDYYENDDDDSIEHSSKWVDSALQKGIEFDKGKLSIEATLFNFLILIDNAIDIKDDITKAVNDPMMSFNEIDLFSELKTTRIKQVTQEKARSIWNKQIILTATLLFSLCKVSDSEKDECWRGCLNKAVFWTRLVSPLSEIFPFLALSTKDKIQHTYRMSYAILGITAYEDVLAKEGQTRLMKHQIDVNPLQTFDAKVLLNQSRTAILKCNLIRGVLEEVVSMYYKNDPDKGVLLLQAFFYQIIVTLDKFHCVLNSHVKKLQDHTRQRDEVLSALLEHEATNIKFSSFQKAPNNYFSDELYVDKFILLGQSYWMAASTFVEMESISKIIEICLENFKKVTITCENFLNEKGYSELYHSILDDEINSKFSVFSGSQVDCCLNNTKISDVVNTQASLNLSYLADSNLAYLEKTIHEIHPNNKNFESSSCETKLIDLKMAEGLKKQLLKISKEAPILNFILGNSDFNTRNDVLSSVKNKIKAQNVTKFKLNKLNSSLQIPLSSIRMNKSLQNLNVESKNVGVSTTDVDFYDEVADPTYSWSQWVLRKQAYKKLSRQNLISNSSQTKLSNSNRSKEIQKSTYKSVETSTKTSKSICTGKLISEIRDVWI